MGKRIKIYQTESYITYLVREAVTIDLDDYPELEGMSNDEIVDYLDGNSCDMKPQDEDYDCLSDELIEKYIIKEKITDENYSYKVEEE